MITATIKNNKNYNIYRIFTTAETFCKFGGYLFQYRSNYTLLHFYTSTLLHFFLLTPPMIMEQAE
jgi:hypothetical protein